MSLKSWFGLSSVSPVSSAPAPVDDASDWDDAKVVLQETGSWIRNADTKVTIVAAALGVLVSTATTNAAPILDCFRSADDGPRTWTVIVGASVGAAAALASIFCVYLSLVPRTKPELAFNRFAWPSLSKLDAAPTMGGGKNDPAQEAWRQCYELSKIAATKYRWFKAGLEWFVLALICVGVAFVAVRA